MIGRTFGRFRIVGSLGEGGMGTVWKAEDDLLGRSVALKLLSARLADSESARARLLREARAAGALDHPGIGTVYDAGEQDGEIFIAMRLVDGGTVADRIQSQGALGLLDAVRIAASAADALGHAHARGILHRDVSARNLMLTKDGQVIVVDFGLALAEGASRLTQSGTTVGTAYYMAPEIALGQQADRRSDIYSLGAVLHEMLTGAPPFEGDRLQAVLYAAVNTRATPPSTKRPEIPPELDRIVLKALAKKPEERYATMEALRDDLEALDASGEVSQHDAPLTIQPRRPTVSRGATPDPRFTPTITLDHETIGGLRRWTRNRRVAIIGSTVLIIGLAAASTAWFVRRSSATVTYASIAVLPFKNGSEKPAESDYLCEGLSQALINKLTQTTDLRVPPWMTVRRFSDPSVPAEKLAAQLRVDALLVGTIDSDGKRIHGSVSLVDGKSGFQIWADEFDEPMAGLFAVQKRIAVGAATRLLGKLSGQQADVFAVPVGASVEAYEYYLKGSFALKKETQAGTDEAAELFHRASEIDPRFAPAWAGAGVVHYRRGGLKEMVAAEDAFGTALDLDPSLIAARRGLVRVLWIRGKSEECLKQGKLIASSSEKGTEASVGRAEAYFFGGLHERALPLLRQVMHDDPANDAAPWFMSMAACWAGHFEEAVNAGEKYLAAFGEDYYVHMWMAVALHSTGRRKEAEAHYRRAIESAPPSLADSFMVSLTAFLRQEHRLDEADRLALDTIDAIETKLLRNPDDYSLHVSLGVAYGLVGDFARMRSEEALVRRAAGDAVIFLGDMGDGYGYIGEKARFVELHRAMLRAGRVDRSYHYYRALYADPQIEDYPDYKELAAEEDAEYKRLDALY